MRKSTSLESDASEMIVKRVSVPIGLEELMEGLAKEVLRKQPEDLYLFAAKYFSHLLLLRDKGNIKVKTVRSAQTVMEANQRWNSKKPPPTTAPKQLSRQFSIRKNSETSSEAPLNLSVYGTGQIGSSHNEKFEKLRISRKTRPKVQTRSEVRDRSSDHKEKPDIQLGSNSPKKSRPRRDSSNRRASNAVRTTVSNKYQTNSSTDSQNSKRSDDKLKLSPHLKDEELQTVREKRNKRDAYRKTIKSIDKNQDNNTKSSFLRSVPLEEVATNNEDSMSTETGNTEGSYPSEYDSTSVSENRNLSEKSSIDSDKIRTMVKSQIDKNADIVSKGEQQIDKEANKYTTSIEQQLQKVGDYKEEENIHGIEGSVLVTEEKNVGNEEVNVDNVQSQGVQNQKQSVENIGKPEEMHQNKKLCVNQELTSNDNRTIDISGEADASETHLETSTEQNFSLFSEDDGQHCNESESKKVLDQDQKSNERKVIEKETEYTKTETGCKSKVVHENITGIDPQTNTNELQKTESNTSQIVSAQEYEKNKDQKSTHRETEQLKREGTGKDTANSTIEQGGKSGIETRNKHSVEILQINDNGEITEIKQELTSPLIESEFDKASAINKDDKSDNYKSEKAKSSVDENRNGDMSNIGSHDARTKLSLGNETRLSQDNSNETTNELARQNLAHVNDNISEMNANVRNNNNTDISEDSRNAGVDDTKNICDIAESIFPIKYDSSIQNDVNRESIEKDMSFIRNNKPKPGDSTNRDADKGEITIDGKYNINQKTRDENIKTTVPTNGRTQDNRIDKSDNNNKFDDNSVKEVDLDHRAVLETVVKEQHSKDKISRYNDPNDSDQSLFKETIPVDSEVVDGNNDNESKSKSNSVEGLQNNDPNTNNIHDNILIEADIDNKHLTGKNNLNVSVESNESCIASEPQSTFHDVSEISTDTKIKSTESPRSVSKNSNTHNSSTATKLKDVTAKYNSDHQKMENKNNTDKSTRKIIDDINSSLKIEDTDIKKHRHENSGEGNVSNDESKSVEVVGVSFIKPTGNDTETCGEDKTSENKSTKTDGQNGDGHMNSYYEQDNGGNDETGEGSGCSSKNHEKISNQSNIDIYKEMLCNLDEDRTSKDTQNNKKDNDNGSIDNQVVIQSLNEQSLDKEKGKSDNETNYSLPTNKSNLNSDTENNGIKQENISLDKGSTAEDLEQSSHTSPVAKSHQGNNYEINSRSDERPDLKFVQSNSTSNEAEQNILDPPLFDGNTDVKITGKQNSTPPNSSDSKNEEKREQNNQHGDVGEHQRVTLPDRRPDNGRSQESCKSIDFLNKGSVDSGYNDPNDSDQSLFKETTIPVDSGVVDEKLISQTGQISDSSDINSHSSSNTQQNKISEDDIDEIIYKKIMTPINSVDHSTQEKENSLKSEEVFENQNNGTEHTSQGTVETIAPEKEQEDNIKLMGKNYGNETAIPNESNIDKLEMIEEKDDNDKSSVRASEEEKSRMKPDANNQEHIINQKELNNAHSVTSLITKLVQHFMDKSSQDSNIVKKLDDDCKKFINNFVANEKKHVFLKSVDEGNIEAKQQYECGDDKEFEGERSQPSEYKTECNVAINESRTEQLSDTKLIPNGTSRQMECHKESEGKIVTPILILQSNNSTLGDHSNKTLRRVKSVDAVGSTKSKTIFRSRIPTADSRHRQQQNASTFLYKKSKNRDIKMNGTVKTLETIPKEHSDSVNLEDQKRSAHAEGAKEAPKENVASKFDIAALRQELSRTQDESTYNPYILREEIREGATIKPKNSDSGSSNFSTMKAVLKIQSLWRGFSIRRTFRKKRSSLKNTQNIKDVTNSAIKIQSIWRAHQARKQFMELKRKQHKVSKDKKKIDSMFESENARKQSNELSRISPRILEPKIKENESSEIKRPPSIDSTDSVVTVIMRDPHEKLDVAAVDSPHDDLDTNLDAITDDQNKLLEQISGTLKRSISRSEIAETADNKVIEPVCIKGGKEALAPRENTLPEKTTYIPEHCSKTNSDKSEILEKDKEIKVEPLAEHQYEMGILDATEKENKGSVSEDNIHNCHKTDHQSTTSEEENHSIIINDSLDQVKYSLSKHEQVITPVEDVFTSNVITDVISKSLQNDSSCTSAVKSNDASSEISPKSISGITTSLIKKETDFEKPIDLNGINDKTEDIQNDCTATLGSGREEITESTDISRSTNIEGSLHQDRCNKNKDNHSSNSFEPHNHVDLKRYSIDDHKNINLMHTSELHDQVIVSNEITSQSTEEHSLAKSAELNDNDQLFHTSEIHDRIVMPNEIISHNNEKNSSDKIDKVDTLEQSADIGSNPNFKENTEQNDVKKSVDKDQNKKSLEHTSDRLIAPNEILSHRAGEDSLEQSAVLEKNINLKLNTEPNDRNIPPNGVISNCNNDNSFEKSADEDRCSSLEHTSEMHDRIIVPNEIICHAANDDSLVQSAVGDKNANLKLNAEPNNRELSSNGVIGNSTDKNSLEKSAGEDDSLEQSTVVNKNINLKLNMEPNDRSIPPDGVMSHSTKTNSLDKSADEDKCSSLEHTSELHDRIIVPNEIINHVTKHDSLDQSAFVDKNINLKLNTEPNDRNILPNGVIRPSIIDNSLDKSKDGDKCSSLEHTSELHDRIIVPNEIISHVAKQNSLEQSAVVDQKMIRKLSTEPNSEKILPTEVISHSSDDNYLKKSTEETKYSSFEHTGEMHDRIIVPNEIIRHSTKEDGLKKSAHADENTNLKHTSELHDGTILPNDSLFAIQQTEEDSLEKSDDAHPNARITDNTELHDSITMPKVYIGNPTDGDSLNKSTVVANSPTLGHTSELHDRIIVPNEIIRHSTEEHGLKKSAHADENTNLKHTSELPSRTVVTNESLIEIQQTEEDSMEKSDDPHTNARITNNIELHDSITMPKVYISNPTDGNSLNKSTVVANSPTLGHTSELHDRIIVPNEIIAHTAEDYSLKKSANGDGNTNLMHTRELHDRIIVPEELKSYAKSPEADNEKSHKEIRDCTQDTEDDHIDISDKAIVSAKEDHRSLQMNYAGSGLLHTSEMHDSAIIPDFNLQNYNETAQNEAKYGKPDISADEKTSVIKDGQVRASPATTDVTVTAHEPGKAALAAPAEAALSKSPDQQSMASGSNSAQGNKNASKDKTMEAEAATKIQAGFRGYKVRKQLKLKNGSSDMEKQRRPSRQKTTGATIKDVEEQSAVKIQAGIRGFLVRRRQKKNAETTK